MSVPRRAICRLTALRERLAARDGVLGAAERWSTYFKRDAFEPWVGIGAGIPTLRSMRSIRADRRTSRAWAEVRRSRPAPTWHCSNRNRQHRSRC